MKFDLTVLRTPINKEAPGMPGASLCIGVRCRGFQSFEVDY